MLSRRRRGGWGTRLRWVWNSHPREEIWAVMEVELGSSRGGDLGSDGGRNSMGDGDGSPERGSAHGVRARDGG